MDDEGRGVLWGVLLGVILLAGALFAGFHWSADKIQSASLSVPPPLLFVPK
jgi:hypothetical protein